jgi:hypothetical protein
VTNAPSKPVIVSNFAMRVDIERSTSGTSFSRAAFDTETSRVQERDLSQVDDDATATVREGMFDCRVTGDAHLVRYQHVHLAGQADDWSVAGFWAHVVDGEVHDHRLTSDSAPSVSNGFDRGTPWPRMNRHPRR